jgi:hypothetical protein
VGIGIARVIVLICGALFAIAGLLLVALPGLAGTGAGIVVFLLGGAMILGALLERIRYRSDALDRSGPPVGPGGGEPLEAALDPRFTSTDEVFVDPTSGRRMRVYTDARTGERRYRAEA